MLEQQSKVRRSISCYSLPALGLADEEIDEQFEERREMHEALRVRQEALQGALNQKLAELKALCLREAELTGELPPETPLRPNEPPPKIKKRMRTEFTLDDKLLTDPKSQEEESLCKVELEFEIQRKIVSASLKLVNEMQTRKSIRKQRKSAYEQAVHKLNILEQRLMPMRRALEENRKDKMRKKQQLIEQLNRSSEVGDLHQHRRENGGEAGKRIKTRMKMSDHNRLGIPPSGLKDGGHRPVTPKVTFVPISPAARRTHRPALLQRPSSATFSNFAQDDLADNGMPASKSVHFSSSSSDHDNVSLGSEGMNSVIIHSDTPPVPRKGILTNSNSNFKDKPRYRPATAVGLPICSANDDTFLRRSNTITSGTFDRCDSPAVSDVVGDLNPGILTRTNSLENTRRKSYVSAISSPPSGSNFRSNHRQSVQSSPSRKTIPKNPPPPVPTSVNMAQRPLPPPPTNQTSVSVPDVPARLIEEEGRMTPLKFSPAMVRKAAPHLRRDKNFDISSRAVRSSVIRTPVGITISTTSSSETQPSTNNGTNLVSSSSSSITDQKPPTPRPNSVLGTSSASYASEQSHIIALPETGTVPNQPLMVTESRTDAEQMPPPRLPTVDTLTRRFQKVSHKPPPIPIANHQAFKTNEPEEGDNQDRVSPARPPTPRACFDELDGLRFPDGASCQHSSRPNVETPRPVSIPLSPTAVSSGANVDVVSVGQFTPYWEETKPYELSDFYKYSAKHRSKQSAINLQAGHQVKPSDDTGSVSSFRTNVSEHSDYPMNGNQLHIPTGPYDHQTMPPLHQQHAMNMSRPSSSSNRRESNLFNESFISNTAVSNDFSEEMYDWYEENLNKASVV